MKVLVIAPRFPAINQPWIDTYLEQLQLNDIDFAICTLNAGNKKYHGKVDHLNLRSHIVGLYPHRMTDSVKFLFSSVAEPRQWTKKIVKSWRLAKEFATYGPRRKVTFFKMLQFGLAGKYYGKVNICHSHGESIAYEFLHYAKLFDIPMLMTFHGLPPAGVSQLSSSKRKLLYDHVEIVLVNTCGAKEQVCELGCDPKKVVVLPQGLPLEEFSYREHVFADDTAIYILTVARLNREKGYGYALLAMRRLLNSGIAIQYHIVGEGPEAARLSRLIERLGLTDYVTLHGSLAGEPLKNLFSSCQLFVLPSVSNKRHDEHVETQGVVLQEAQASGCIPIATRVGGIPECLNHERDALLVKDRSSKAVADAVCQLIDDGDKWQTYQRNGRQNVEENFSAAVIGKKMAAILRQHANG